MSTRRKFVIALNLVAICIAAFAYAKYRFVPPIPISPAIELQLVPLQTIAVTHQHLCGSSCVVTTRAALGVDH